LLDGLDHDVVWSVQNAARKLFAQNGALGAHCVILEDGPELAKAPSAHAEGEGHVRAGLLVATRLDGIRKGRRPGYSFGDITIFCRHCFEGFAGGANVITNISANHDGWQGVKDPRGPVGMTASSTERTPVYPATPRGPDQANALSFFIHL
jgi:hypothetical protein